MNRKLAVAPIAAALTLAAVAGGSAPASAAAPPRYVIAGTTSIGGYRSGAGYARARTLFGGPVSSKQDLRTCVAGWATGLTIAWHRRLPYAKWQKACVAFMWARVKGKQWRTDKGLRVGSSESQIRKLYPRARRTSRSGYAVWKLQTASKVSLQAWVKRGRVVSFRLVKS